MNDLIIDFDKYTFHMTGHFYGYVTKEKFFIYDEVGCHEFLTKNLSFQSRDDVGHDKIVFWCQRPYTYHNYEETPYKTLIKVNGWQFVILPTSKDVINFRKLVTKVKRNGK